MSNQTIEIEIQAKLKGLVKKEGIEASIILEVPRDKGHGELSCNVALIAAKQVKRSPREIADKLAAAFPTLPGGVSKVEVAGPGFINFHLEPLYFHRLLADIVKDPARFGDSDEGNSEKWHFEYVSANPTGPLNVVSARAASIGDTLVNVFKKRGFSVYNEFYVNDGGGQVRKFGSSVRARIEQIKTGTDTAAIPEGGYHGEYVLDSARTWLENPTEPYPAEDDDAFQAFDENIGRWAAYRLRDEQKETLEKFRVTFDNWLKESEIFDNSQGLATPQTAIERPVSPWREFPTG